MITILDQGRTLWFHKILIYCNIVIHEVAQLNFLLLHSALQSQSVQLVHRDNKTPKVKYDFRGLCHFCGVGDIVPIKKIAMYLPMFRNGMAID